MIEISDQHNMIEVSGQHSVIKVSGQHVLVVTTCSPPWAYLNSEHNTMFNCTWMPERVSMCFYPIDFNVFLHVNVVILCLYVYICYILRQPF